MAPTSLRLGIAYLLIALAPLILAVRGVHETHRLEPSSLSHVDGASYIASIRPSPFAPLLVARSDDPSDGQRSSARLFEDGRELRPAHALHVGIAAIGKGRFSHWTTAVYLSASDNSDPRTNGRLYRLQTTARLPIAIVGAWALTFLFAVAISAWSRRSSTQPARRWWLPCPRPLVLALVSVAAVVLMATAGPAAAFWALASWLVVGFVAALCAGVVMCRVPATDYAKALTTIRQALTSPRNSVGLIVASIEQRTFDHPGWIRHLARVAGIAVSVGIFMVTVTNAWPESVLVRAYRGGGLVIMTAAAAVWLAHAARGWLAILFGVTVTLALCALPLAALWQDVTVHYNVIGGLLPFSDAQGYYFEASSLLDGHPVVWSARRPLFTAFLALLLAMTHSLSISLAIMVVLNGVAIFLLAREVRRSFGATGATVATLIMFAFYRHDGGTGAVLSENLGSLLGTAAFTALLRGARLQDMRSYLSGAVLLTAGLMARAGAFFVLPALVVVAPLSLPREGTRGMNRRPGLATLAAIVIAAAAFLTWGKTVSDPAAGNAAFSNYSQSLYGLVVGGKGWTQIHIDHPNATEGAEIYALAYEAFRARPGGLVEGLARMVRAYLWPSEPYHAFAFIQDDSRTALLQRLCYLLTLTGLGTCVWRWRDPVNPLLLAVAAGHLASIPFVPPIDAGLRVYAATTPILALLVAAGIALPVKLLAAIRDRLVTRTAPDPRGSGVTSRLPESAALVLLVVVMGASWTLYAVGAPTTLPRASCPNGAESLLVRLNGDAVLHIHDDRSPRAISPTDLRQSEAQLSVGLVELRGEAGNLRAGMSLAFAYDQLDGRQVWLAGDTGRLQGHRGALQICGHYAADALARRYGLMYVDEVRAAGIR